MTTSINMSSCFENPQSALISAFQRRNLDAFKYALEHLRADPNAIDPRIDMSIFEKVLLTPKSSDYISLCIDNGADLYTKNSRGRYPLHFAIDSLWPDNLQAFLSFYDPKMINVRYGNQNCLHILLELLPSLNDKYDEIAECIKMLIKNGCDPNMPNEKSRTPFFSLLRVQPKLKNPNELVEFFLEHSRVDIYTYKGNDMKRMFEKQNPTLQLPEKVDKTVNCDYMLSLLRAGKETEFNNNFPLFKEAATKTQNNTNDENKSNSFAEDCVKFLYTAIQSNMETAVDLLVNEKVDVNKRPANSNYVRQPVFLACASGYHRIVDLLLKSSIKPETIFEQKNLLHEVCSHFGMDPSRNESVNYQKCFELVVDNCDVNAKDSLGCTPLHYAVRYRNDDAVQALLKKASYVGTKNILGETPLDDMNREVLEEFLDKCVSTNVRRTGDEEHEISIDYNFLMAPRASKLDDEFRPEVAPLQIISDNSELRPLILHPVMSSFLLLKWSKLQLLFYVNLLMFSIFMVSLIMYIVLCQSIPFEDRGANGFYCFFYVVSIIGIVFLALREIFQCILSVKHYIKSPINWFEIALIILGCIVLVSSEEDGTERPTLRILRAVTILFAAYEFLQLAGNLPFLSVSTHMVILKKVAITFLKSILLYSIVLFAFALSFFTLFGGKKSDDDKEEALMKNSTKPDKPSECCKDKDDDDDEFNSFGYPGIAIIKTFVMLTGEFDASALDLDRNGVSYSIIFLLFVFLVTIVLFNLLNALAVDDTQVIKSEGQLVDLCQRIAVLDKYEKIILGRSGWRTLKAYISIFPYTVPNGKVVIRPNKSNEILTMKPRQASRDASVRVEDGQEQELQTLKNSSLEEIIPNRQLAQKLERFSTLDPKIMKNIRSVLEQRNENRLKEEREDALRKQIQRMESQLKMLTDLLTKNKNNN